MACGTEVLPIERPRGTPRRSEVNRANRRTADYRDGQDGRMSHEMRHKGKKRKEGLVRLLFRLTEEWKV